MSKNANLHAAKAAKNDEFYTRFDDVCAEVHKYRDQFAGKTVLCPCDDVWSGFFHYFYMNFERLGLKKLICTHYDNSGENYCYIYEGGVPGCEKDSPMEKDRLKLQFETNPGTPKGFTRVKLEGDGDFRSPEMAKYFDEADIVVTNPPFSLFREFIHTIVKHECDFLVIGDINAITYKEIFPLVMENKVWPGITHPKKFFRPDGTIQEFGKIGWYTNMAKQKRNDGIELTCRYIGHEEEYPKYDNYDAIEVSKTKNIPSDYNGVMGVPISFLDKYNPEQFEIVGLDRYVDDNPKPGRRFTINGKETYARVLIRRK